MAGMLSQGNPSSGPERNPPRPGPGAGAPPATPGTPPGAAAPGPGQPPQAAPGQPQDVEALRKQAIQLVYGERFDQLIKMFQTNGAENFPRSMAVAVNTAIDELEKTNGPIPPEVAAEVGMDLMMKLLEDMITGGVVPDVKLEQVQDALPAIMIMYADARPDVSKEDIQAVIGEVTKGVGDGQQSGMQPEGPASSGTPGPESANPASPPADSVPPKGEEPEKK